MTDIRQASIEDLQAEIARRSESARQAKAAAALVSQCRQAMTDSNIQTIADAMGFTVDQVRDHLEVELEIVSKAVGPDDVDEEDMGEVDEDEPCDCEDCNPSYGDDWIKYDDWDCEW